MIFSEVNSLILSVTEEPIFHDLLVYPKRQVQSDVRHFENYISLPTDLPVCLPLYVPFKDILNSTPDTG